MQKSEVVLIITGTSYFLLLVSHIRIRYGNTTNYTFTRKRWFAFAPSVNEHWHIEFEAILHAIIIN